MDINVSHALLEKLEGIQPRRLARGRSLSRMMQYNNYHLTAKFNFIHIIFFEGMMQSLRLLIKASVPTKDRYVTAIVGDCKLLGEWDILHAVILRKRNDGLWEFEQPLTFHKGERIEFKLVQLGPNGQTLWEDLPGNLNRRFTIIEEVVLTMSWSNPMGERKKLKKRRLSSSTAPSFMLIEPTKRDASMSLGNFDPFKIAEHSDQDDDEHCKQLTPPMPPFNYGKKEFEELYYSNNNSIAIAKKIANNSKGSVFVISKDYPSEHTSNIHFVSQFAEIGTPVNWIVEHVPLFAPKCQPFHFISLRKKAGGLSDENLQWLFQQYVEEIVPDFSTVIIIGSIFSQLKINNSSAKGIIFECLPDLDRLTELLHEAAPVILTSQSKEIRETLNKVLNEQSFMASPNKIVQSSFERALEEGGQRVIEILHRKLKNSVSEIMQNQRRSSKKMSLTDVQLSINEHENSIIIIDWDIISQCLSEFEKYYSFLEGLRVMSSAKGRFICIVSNQSRAELQSQFGFLAVSNIHFYLNQGKEVRLNRKWFSPYQKLNGVVEAIRKKLERLQQGGQTVEIGNSITYTCKCPPTIRKLHSDISRFLNQEQLCYLAVEMNEQQTTLKINWQYDPVNVFETLIRLKCMAQGSLSYALAIMHNQQSSLVFSSLNMLTRTFPSLFRQNFKADYVTQGNKLAHGSHYSIQLDDLEDFTFKSKD